MLSINFVFLLLLLLQFNHTFLVYDNIMWPDQMLPEATQNQNMIFKPIFTSISFRLGIFFHIVLLVQTLFANKNNKCLPSSPNLFKKVISVKHLCLNFKLITFIAYKDTVNKKKTIYPCFKVFLCLNIRQIISLRYHE